MKKTLLVDDDFLVRSYLKMLSSWERAGFHIIADVKNGEEALEVLEQNPIDLIVTDIAMPMMDGVSLIREVRKKYREIYIIVLSCHDEFEYVRQAMKEGANEYILKNTLNEGSLYTILEVAGKHLTGIENSARTTVGQIMPESKQRETDSNSKFLFFNKILAGTLTGQERERQRVLAGVQGKYNNSAVIVIRADDADNPQDLWTEVRKEERGHEFVNRLRREMQAVLEGAEADVVYVGGGVCCCFLDLSGERRSSLMYQKLTRMAAVCWRVCRQENRKYRIGVSSACIGADALRQAYQQARMMVKAGFYEEDKIIYYEPEKLMKNELPVRAREILKEMEESVRTRNTKRFRELAEEASVLFCIERTDRQIVLRWLQKAVHSAEAEDVLDSQHIGSIKDVKECILSICRKIEEWGDVEFPEHVSVPVQKAALFARQNFREPIGLNDAAAEAGVNSTYLSYLFGKEMGIGFSGYVLRLRIEYACTLLEKGGVKVREAAVRSGFSDVHYFSKVFKKMTGQSPASYTKRREVE